MFMAMAMALLLFGKEVVAQQQLSGVVLYAGNPEWPMPDVTVGLYDLGDSLIMSTKTDDAGMYLFENVPSGQYNLVSSTNQEPRGVNIGDAYLILMNLLGFCEFDETEQQVADVNGSGAVTWNDYSLMIINYLLYDQSFPVGDWIFQEHYIDLSARYDSEENDTTWGFVAGDVGPTESNGGGGRSANLTNATWEELNVNGNDFIIEVRADAPGTIAGYTLNLAYPAREFEITGVSGFDANLNYRVDPDAGLLRLTWLDQSSLQQGVPASGQLMKVEFKAKTDRINGELFSLSEGTLFIDANGKTMEGVTVILPYLKRQLVTAPAELSTKIYPNPVSGRFTIEIQSPTQTVAAITFFDLQGREICRFPEISISKGANKIGLDAERFPPGHYIYTIDLGNEVHGSLNGRMFRSSQ